MAKLNTIIGKFANKMDSTNVKLNQVVQANNKAISSKKEVKLEATMEPHHSEPIHDGEPNDVKSTHTSRDDKQPLSGDGASPG
ncbi:unnamed protein product [Dovyalis caffra]|uniref:Uncharacterized protein n=1 Tax=Dovyalis caffra TaxID=77055 RepID=A0AAV1R515_9ROSI|nr:unnamed protein product [Dovyalis caffra]